LTRLKKKSNKNVFDMFVCQLFLNYIKNFITFCFTYWEIEHLYHSHRDISNYTKHMYNIL